MYRNKSEDQMLEGGIRESSWRCFGLYSELEARPVIEVQLAKPLPQTFLLGSHVTLDPKR